MKKKKIIFFAGSLYGGGAERILQIICSHFDFSQYEILMYSLHKNKQQNDYYPDDISFKYIFDVIEDGDSGWIRILKKIKNKAKLWIYYHCSPSVFYRLFIRDLPDVVIAFLEGYATRIVSGFPKGTKKIAWLHTEMLNNHWSKIAYLFNNDEEKAYLSMNHIVCVSLEVRRQLELVFPKVRTGMVLHNPVDISMIIQKSKEFLPPHFKKKESTKRLISIGSLIEIKGHLRLLKAVKLLIQDGYDIELLLLGKGNLHDNLSKYIINNQLGDRVFLLGYQENPYNYLTSSDIYVCSSYAEGYNTAITESLVLGKAVVSTECSGVKEQLGENNEWGICVPNSEEGIYQGLKEMLEEKALRHYTKQAIIRGKSFTLDESMKKIYSIIDS